jgi:hypothetical protein
MLGANQQPWRFVIVDGPDVKPEAASRLIVVIATCGLISSTNGRTTIYG